MHVSWDGCCVQFLSACLEEPCPAPGQKLVVRVPSIKNDGALDELRLSRPEVSTAVSLFFLTCGWCQVNEILLDYVTFFTLFSCVSVKNIVHLFSNALLERRIILVAEVCCSFPLPCVFSLFSRICQRSHRV